MGSKPSTAAGGGQTGKKGEQVQPSQTASSPVAVSPPITSPPTQPIQLTIPPVESDVPTSTIQENVAVEHDHTFAAHAQSPTPTQPIPSSSPPQTPRGSDRPQSAARTRPNTATRKSPQLAREEEEEQQQQAVTIEPPPVAVPSAVPIVAPRFERLISTDFPMNENESPGPSEHPSRQPTPVKEEEEGEEEEEERTSGTEPITGEAAVTVVEETPEETAAAENVERSSSPSAASKHEEGESKDQHHSDSEQQQSDQHNTSTDPSSSRPEEEQKEQIVDDENYTPFTSPAHGTKTPGHAPLSARAPSHSSGMKGGRGRPGFPTPSTVRLGSSQAHVSPSGSAMVYPSSLASHYALPPQQQHNQSSPSTRRPWSAMVTSPRSKANGTLGYRPSPPTGASGASHAGGKGRWRPSSGLTSGAATKQSSLLKDQWPYTTPYDEEEEEEFFDAEQHVSSEYLRKPPPPPPSSSTSHDHAPIPSQPLASSSRPTSSSGPSSRSGRFRPSTASSSTSRAGGGRSSGSGSGGRAARLMYLHNMPSITNPVWDDSPSTRWPAPTTSTVGRSKTRPPSAAVLREMYGENHPFVVGSKTRPPSAMISRDMYGESHPFAQSSSTERRRPSTSPTKGGRRPATARSSSPGLSHSHHGPRDTSPRQAVSTLDSLLDLADPLSGGRNITLSPAGGGTRGLKHVLMNRPGSPPQILRAQVSDWSGLVEDLGSGGLKAHAASRAIHAAEELLNTARELARRAQVAAALEKARPRKEKKLTEQREEDLKETLRMTEERAILRAERAGLIQQSVRARRLKKKQAQQAHAEMMERQRLLEQEHKLALAAIKEKAAELLQKNLERRKNEPLNGTGGSSSPRKRSRSPTKRTSQAQPQPPPVEETDPSPAAPSETSPKQSTTKKRRSGKKKKSGRSGATKKHHQRPHSAVSDLLEEKEPETDEQDSPDLMYSRPLPSHHKSSDAQHGEPEHDHTFLTSVAGVGEEESKQSTTHHHHHHHHHHHRTDQEQMAEQAAENTAVTAVVVAPGQDHDSEYPFDGQQEEATTVAATDSIVVPPPADVSPLKLALAASRSLQHSVSLPASLTSALDLDSLVSNAHSIAAARAYPLRPGPVRARAPKQPSVLSWDEPTLLLGRIDEQGGGSASASQTLKLGEVNVHADWREDGAEDQTELKQEPPLSEEPQATAAEPEPEQSAPISTAATEDVQAETPVPVKELAVQSEEPAKTASPETIIGAPTIPPLVIPVPSSSALPVPLPTTPATMQPQTPVQELHQAIETLSRVLSLHRPPSAHQQHHPHPMSVGGPMPMVAAQPYYNMGIMNQQPPQAMYPSDHGYVQQPGYGMPLVHHHAGVYGAPYPMVSASPTEMTYASATGVPAGGFYPTPPLAPSVSSNHSSRPRTPHSSNTGGVPSRSRPQSAVGPSRFDVVIVSQPKAPVSRPSSALRSQPMYPGPGVGVTGPYGSVDRPSSAHSGRSAERILPSMVLAREQEAAALSRVASIESKVSVTAQQPMMESKEPEPAPESSAEPTAPASVAPAAIASIPPASIGGSKSGKSFVDRTESVSRTGVKSGAATPAAGRSGTNTPAAAARSGAATPATKSGASTPKTVQRKLATHKSLPASQAPSTSTVVPESSKSRPASRAASSLRRDVHSASRSRRSRASVSKRAEPTDQEEQDEPYADDTIEPEPAQIIPVAVAEPSQEHPPTTDQIEPEVEVEIEPRAPTPQVAEVGEQLVQPDALNEPSQTQQMTTEASSAAIVDESTGATSPEPVPSVTSDFLAQPRLAVHISHSGSNAAIEVHDPASTFSAAQSVQPSPMNQSMIASAGSSQGAPYTPEQEPRVRTPVNSDMVVESGSQGMSQSATNTPLASAQRHATNDASEAARPYSASTYSPEPPQQQQEAVAADPTSMVYSPTSVASRSEPQSTAAGITTTEEGPRDLASEHLAGLLQTNGPAGTDQATGPIEVPAAASAVESTQTIPAPVTPTVAASIPLSNASTFPLSPLFAPPTAASSDVAVTRKVSLGSVLPKKPTLGNTTLAAGSEVAATPMAVVAPASTELTMEEDDYTDESYDSESSDSTDASSSDSDSGSDDEAKIQ